MPLTCTVYDVCSGVILYILHRLQLSWIFRIRPRSQTETHRLAHGDHRNVCRTTHVHAVYYNYSHKWQTTYVTATASSCKGVTVGLQSETNHSVTVA